MPASSRLTILQALLIGALTTSLALKSFAQDESAADIKACISIESDVKRLECYDRASGRSKNEDSFQEPVSAATDESSVVHEPAPAPLPEPFQRSRKSENLEARVIRCGKNALGKNLYYLDNGQVWKQVSDKRVSVKECDFGVLITKDMFGFKMQREGEDAKIRISRIR